MGTCKRAIILLVLTTASCPDPDQNDPNRYGTVSVGFGPSLDRAIRWDNTQIVELRAELRVLNALGPTFVEGTEGTATYVVRPFDSGPGCPEGAGRWILGTSFVEIDPVCCRGFVQLRAVMGHELGHILGMSHVCFRSGEAPDCSPVGYGTAMMNPMLTNPGQDLAQAEPTALDLAEFRRTHP